jgi:heme/copper-type cytochrome/quinol oxidase subunit 2
VTVTSGTQNPSGAIEQVTGLIFGHDSITTLDNVRILNVAGGSTSTPIWQEFWFWIAIVVAVVILVVIAFYVNKKSVKRNTSKAQVLQS